MISFWYHNETTHYKRRKNIDNTKNYNKDSNSLDTSELDIKEKLLYPSNGFAYLLLNSLAMLASIFFIIINAITLEQKKEFLLIPVLVIIISGIYLCIIGPILYAGLRILRPNEALVLTLFGKYYGTIKNAGFYFVNPFAVGFNPTTNSSFDFEGFSANLSGTSKQQTQKTPVSKIGKKISLKSMTLNNGKQKINDLLGNPIEIGVVVIWKITNTTKAVFNVDDYIEYLSIQSDSAIRNIARLYPYDLSNTENNNDDEMSLRGSSAEVTRVLKEELQNRVDIAGIEIIEARITHLAYSPEIAAAMLQRQQASAIIDARKMIVDGAVGMVEMALDKLNEKDLCKLDEERKAAMVSNLLVVLCGNKDVQPIVNSGSLY